MRTELQFDEAHIPAAVCITARRAGFGSKLAWLARPEQPIVLVGRDDEDAFAAAALAGAVGLRNLAGYLAGGMTSWREDALPVERVDRMTVEQLHGRWEPDRGALQVLDVREREEWDAGHIPGSVHLPYHDIHGLPGNLDPERPIATVCASGQRSAVAASVLTRLGARAVVHVVDGGVPLWQRRAGRSRPRVRTPDRPLRARPRARGREPAGPVSVLAVPVLVYALDQTAPQATTASLLVVAAGAVAGALSHARAGRVCWRHAGSFIPPTSQNQRPIEEDLRAVVEQHVDLPDDDCGCAASRRSATTTRASRARPTSSSSRSTVTEPVVVVGVGNALRGDDGAGLAVARRLRERAPTAGVGIRALEGRGSGCWTPGRVRKQW